MNMAECFEKFEKDFKKIFDLIEDTNCNLAEALEALSEVRRMISPIEQWLDASRVVVEE